MNNNVQLDNSNNNVQFDGLQPFISHCTDKGLFIIQCIVYFKITDMRT